MEVYVARQPIFDREMKVLGYELKYSRSENELFTGTKDRHASADVVHEAFLTRYFNVLTNHTKAFIHFSDDLVYQEIPQILPKRTLIVQVLDGNEITDEQILAYKRLKNKGYTIVLEDFIFHHSFQNLIDLADIVKVDFQKFDRNLQLAIVRQYRPRIDFLAKNVNTREDYELAYGMRYKYFQGNFYKKPLEEGGSLAMRAVHILNEFGKQNMNFDYLVDIIENDAVLAQQFLDLSNSAIYHSSTKITSLMQALVRLGTAEIRNWMHALILKEAETSKNKELLKESFTRAKFMELLSERADHEYPQEYFLVGLFSDIDALLNREMEDILDELEISLKLKVALLGKKNHLGEMLELVRSFEYYSTWTEESKQLQSDFTEADLMNSYIEALTWTNELLHQ